MTRESPRPAWGLFGHRGFAAVFLAHSVSQLGDRIHQLALAWWTMATTGSVGWTGAVLIATTLPTVLLSPVAGTLADRMDRRTLMMASDVARAVVAGALAGLAWRGQLTVVVLMAASALLAALTTLFTPAALAVTPTLVPEDKVLPATSLMESSVQGAALAGPVLGGVVVAALGAAGAFGLNAASFLVSALLLLAVPRRPVALAGGHEPFRAAAAGGFRFLRHDRTVAGVLVCFAAVNVFTMPVLLFMPYFASQVFGVGATGLGWMEAALGLGMLGAAVFWASRGRATSPFPVVTGGLLGVAAAVAVMGLWPRYPVHLASLVAAGAAMGSVNVVVVAWFQTRVPPSEAGRFFGLMTSLASGLIPVSYGIFGVIGERLSPAWLLTGNAAAIAAIAGALALVPGFRDVRPST
ncbi:MAG: MFS transporter [Candidatus Sericytochromatia bacterium]|nr:MFS transporter [Candidatus Sericytochromatia bacterium]